MDNWICWTSGIIFPRRIILLSDQVGFIPSRNRTFAHLIAKSRKFCSPKSSRNLNKNSPLKYSQFPFLFQAETLTRSRITKFRKLFYNPKFFYKISIYFLFQAETALKLILSPNFVVQNRVSKSQYTSLVHQNVYNQFLFQLHFNSQILSRNFENYSTSPKSRVKVSTSPPLSLLPRTSKYSHTSYSKLHFNSSRPPPILGSYNNRGRSNMSRYTRVSGSNSLVSRYYATSDSIRTVTTSRRDCLNCDHLPAPIATILHAASARSHN